MRIRIGLAGTVAIVGAMSASCAAPRASLDGPTTPVDAVGHSTALLSAAIAAPASTEAKGEPEAFPITCSSTQAVKDLKACLPPPSFGKKLCSGIYPEVALALFTKGTPWTRVWLAGDIEAWNASGGLTHRTKLAFDEEVLVLSRHAAPGGIVTTGAMASYDVLRWDGTCVSVLEGELTTRRPPVPKPAPVPWGRLEEMTRRALLASPKVKASHDFLGKSCSGVGSTFEKKACEKADKAFAGAVAEFVRSGGSLPTPTRRP